MSGVAEADSGALVKTTVPGPLPVVDRMATGTATGSALERWLEQSGVAISLGGLLAASLLGAVLFGLAGGALVGHPLVTGACALVGLVVPSAVLRGRRLTRLRKFEEHFPGARPAVESGPRGPRLQRGSQDDR